MEWIQEKKNSELWAKSGLAYREATERKAREEMLGVGSPGSKQAERGRQSAAGHVRATRHVRGVRVTELDPGGCILVPIG